MINVEFVVNARSYFARFWQTLGWLTIFAVTAFYLYCLISGRGVSPHEVGELGWWIWIGGMAGAMIENILIVWTLGKDEDSSYVKTTYPDIWRKFFPAKFMYNNVPMLKFVMGKYGDINDLRLEEVRMKWKQEFYIFALPLVLSVCIFFSFFFWRALGLLNVK